LPGVELVSASYRNRAFPLHAHAEYVVGVIVEGAEVLSVRGRRHRLVAGDTLLLNPGEAHSNSTLDANLLSYCVFYLPEGSLALYLPKDANGVAVMPTFSRPATSARHIYTSLINAHANLRANCGRMEQETTLSMLAQTLLSCASSASAPAKRREDGRIDRARAFIDAHFAEHFGLADLALVAGLSPFHFIRCFREQVGLTPLAYRNQCRVAEARRLLLQGLPLAATALEVGFSDQSHLTRQFQRLVGTSPARYLQQ
jgi:AraC-like DNA-binding protein